MTGQRAEVLYFHQVDDPYSHLTAQVLQDLQSRYDIDLKVLLVDQPADDAAPERDALIAYSRRDAAKIAPFHNLTFTDPGKQPSEASLNLARRALAASSNRVQVATTIGEAPFGKTAPTSSTAWRWCRRKNRRRICPRHQNPGGDWSLFGRHFFFEGEWYWGVDRLPYLEERMAKEGLRLGGCQQIVHFQQRPEFMSGPSNGKPPDG